MLSGEADIQWRCRACAAISQGFAFPYGLCPQCGGKLDELNAPRAHLDAKWLGLRSAFEIELGARAFYQRAAIDTRDPVLRKLFGRFAIMEGEHMEALAQRYQFDVPTASKAFRIELAAIFADIESRPQDPDNLFRIAIALEKRAAEFFAKQASQAGAGTPERRLYEELAEEEREHAHFLGGEFARWRDSRPGVFADARASDATTSTATGAVINAAALLLDHHQPQRTALVCGDQRLSYGELRERVARTASVWAALGVQPGDRVAIKLADGFDWVVAFLGTLWRGAIAVAVNPRIPAPEWQYILDEAGFSVILAESREDTILPWRERVLPVQDWRVAVEAAAPISAHAVDPSTPALWCHSSGTSGKPKAVVHAHRFAQQIERVSREGLGIGSDDRLFASSKLFFAYPQTNSLFAGLKLGATVIVDPQWPTAESVIACVEQQRPTVLFCVPSLYRNLLNEGLAPRVAAAGVRLCVSAGEPLPARLREEWRRQTKLPMIDGYGASETMVLVMLCKDDAAGLTPSPGVEFKPLSPELAPGMPTRLCFSVPTVALGYLDRPQAQMESFRDGAFCPADLFVQEPSGVWRFAGREDSLVKINGRWVNLIELEERLSAQSPDILEAAAVCVPDADGVDAVAFFYVTRDPLATSAALLARIETLQHHQRPRWLHPIATLPRTATGKLLRRKLQELHRTLE